jgi:hypothetical protein
LHASNPEAVVRSAHQRTVRRRSFVFGAIVGELSHGAANALAGHEGPREYRCNCGVDLGNRAIHCDRLQVCIHFCQLVFGNLYVARNGGAAADECCAILCIDANRAGETPQQTQVRPLVLRTVRGHIKRMLWQQGILRHSDEELVESALRDWRAVPALMSDGPFFFGDGPTGVDAIVFGALATSVLTPIESPIRDFLRSQPACIAYAERMRARFFPELAAAPSRGGAAQAKGTSRAA